MGKAVSGYERMALIVVVSSTRASRLSLAAEVSERTLLVRSNHIHLSTETARPAEIRKGPFFGVRYSALSPAVGIVCAHGSQFAAVLWVGRERGAGRPRWTLRQGRHVSPWRSESDQPSFGSTSTNNWGWLNSASSSARQACSS